MAEPLVRSTACLDWRERLREGRSIIPPPLYPAQAEEALNVFKQLRIVDAPGSPTFGESCAPWVFDLVASIFGAYNAQTGRREITEWFVCIPKKNSKALALDTPIPSPAGWTTMGALRPGDVVFGVDGKPCKVTATSEVFYDHDCYEVEFSNGERVIADAGHLWETRALSDEDKRHKFKVRTTKEIADSLLYAKRAKNHSLRLPAPLDGPDIDLPVAPYTLGAWLGDGTSAAAQITFDPADAEIKEGIEADGWPMSVRNVKGPRAVTWSMSLGRTQKHRDAGLATKLRAMGVLNNKHIPEVYLRASFEQRLALLQGLMDTDGSINKTGECLTFVGVNRRLVEQVGELLSTMGLKYSLITRPMFCNGVLAGEAHHLQFCAFRDHLPVFRLKRKLARMRLSTDGVMAQSRSRSVQIVRATPVPSVPVKCITVDNPDHLFLFGRTMLPTHNSTVAAGIMLTALILNWRDSAEFAVVAPTIEVAGNAYAPARDMVKVDEDLEGLLHVQNHVRTITHRIKGGMLKVIAADSNTVGGKKSVGTLIDELHLFGKQANAEGMFREALGGLASRPEGFVVYLTTQSDEPPAGVYKQKLDYARAVRDGKIVDERFVPIIFEFPEDMLEAGEHLKPENFRIVNPNLNYSVDAEFLSRELKKAQEAGEESLRGFLAKHLNVEIGLALKTNSWAGAEFWERAVEKGLTLDEILKRSDVITVGADGGGLDDLFGLSVIGRDATSGKWLHWAHAWAHPIVLERRKSEAARFRDFAKAGELTIVQNIGDDLSQVADIVEKCEESGLLDKIGVDQAGIGALVDEIVAREIEFERIVGIPQGWKLNGAIKTTERKLAEGNMVHGGSKLMAWSVGNAKVEPRGNAIVITKQAAGFAKIDPLMATFNAAALMAMNPKPRKKSYQLFVLGG